MTEEELRAIEERAAKARHGDWHTVGNTLYARAPTPGSPCQECLDYWVFPGDLSTADFFAHAPADVSALVAEVRRLRAEIAEGWAAAHDLHEHVSSAEELRAMEFAEKAFRILADRTGVVLPDPGAPRKTAPERVVLLGREPKP